MAEKTLSSVLLEIGQALDGLIDLSQRKARVVIENDMAGLDAIVRSEEELSRRLASLEDERSKAAACAADADEDEIEALRQSLREKVEGLKVLNERNQRLLKQGLDLVEFQLKLLMPQPSYKGAPRPGPVMIDIRV